MKSALAVIFALSLNLVTLNLAAQATKTSPAPAPSASTTSVSSSSSATAEAAKAPDLPATLTDAENVITSTTTDLAGLRTDKWSSGWKGGWAKKGVNKQQLNQTLEALRTTAGQLPAMVVDVRTAHGSVGSAFKLYNQLTAVSEALDSLAEAAQNYGKKEDYAKLSGDYAGLLRIRGNLSAYVEQRASVVDPKGNISSLSASAAKKDDSAKKTVAKHVVKKKSAVRTSD